MADCSELVNMLFALSNIQLFSTNPDAFLFLGQVMKEDFETSIKELRDRYRPSPTIHTEYESRLDYKPNHIHFL